MRKVFLSSKYTVRFFLFLFITPFIFSMGCKKENKSNSGGNFELIDNPGILDVPLDGISVTYQVKADGLWLIDVVDGGPWIKISQLEGRGDGSFTIVIDKNRTNTKRESGLVFRSNFIRQPEYLKIVQQANPNPPYFEVAGGVNKLEALGHGAKETFQVNSNTTWEVKIKDQADWVHIQPASGQGDGSFSVTVDPNPLYTARSTSLTFVVDGVEQSNLFEITQEGKVDETVILNEDFNWLAYGSAIFYTTTGETRIDSWTQEQLDKGWTSSVNTVSGSGNTPLLYARQGFVKVGKTSYGGDLVSPKLSAVNGVQDLVVSFKAVPYQTQAGSRDGNTLKIQILGPGTPSVQNFTINNWPDYTNDPGCTEIWNAAETTRKFEIQGATSETQIVFIGGDYDLRTPVDPNKNRIFLDDIIVTVK